MLAEVHESDGDLRNPPITTVVIALHTSVDTRQWRVAPNPTRIPTPTAGIRNTEAVVQWEAAECPGCPH